MRDIENYQKVYLSEKFEEYKIRYRRLKVLEQITKYHSKRVIEIGCGWDPLFQYIDHELEGYVLAEPGEHFYRNAMEIAKSQKKEIEGYCEVFSSDKKFSNFKPDFIVCTSLLHEVEEPEKLLEDIVKASGHDTVIHINVPNANSFHRLLGSAMGILKGTRDLSENNIKMQQHTMFDIDSLQTMLEKAGLSVLEAGDFFVKPFSHAQMYAMLESKIIDDRTIEGLYHLSEKITGIGSEIYANCKIHK